MAEFNEICNTMLICGDVNRVTERFNSQTNFEQVHDYVRQLFHNHLPSSFRIVYYDPQTMSMTDLKSQFEKKSNPFQINSSDGVRSSTSTSDCLRLYIVAGTVCRIVSVGEQISLSDAVDDIQSESSILTNDDVSQTNEQLPTFIPPSIDLTKQRLAFILDVKSHQRHIYKTDQFNVRTGLFNGRIARIQGIKDESQKMLQILPKLQIPKEAVHSNVTLLVAVVSEEVHGRTRIWCKHPDKGFLPEGYERDTEPINPIVFPLNEKTVSNNGQFTLGLQMITKWAKSRKDRDEVYRYDDQKTRMLHPAETDSKSPRLICVLQQNDQPIWETFCLSDFIRTPITSRQRSTSVTTGITDSRKRKRSRHSD